MNQQITKLLKEIEAGREYYAYTASLRQNSAGMLIQNQELKGIEISGEGIELAFDGARITLPKIYSITKNQKDMYTVPHSLHRVAGYHIKTTAKGTTAVFIWKHPKQG